MANGATNSNSRSLLLLLLTSGFFFTALLFDYMPMIVDNQIRRTVELATNEEIQSIWLKPPIDVHSYYWLYDVLNAERFMAGDKIRVRKVGPFHFTRTVELATNEEIQSIWLKPPIDVHSYYWLYDVLNAERFMAGDKIRVRKVGPFHFTSRFEKRIIELSQNKYRLVYNSTRHIYLNQSAPGVADKLDEPLVLLNPVYVSLMEGSREFSAKLDNETARMVVVSANRLADRFNESLFLNTTAREALLGRKVMLIEKARKLATTFNLDVKLPESFDSNKFGFVAIMNNTWQGPYEIYTGYQASMPSLGEIISFKGKRRLTDYRGKCNRLQASAGELRPMPLIEDQVLEMFTPQLCRIVHLKPTGVRKLREGLAVSYMHATEDFLAADLNPDNNCFCINATSDNYCSLSGAIELAPCSHFSPIVLTTSVIEPDVRILQSIADYDPDLLVSEVEHLATPSKTAQLLLLKRIGVPAKVDLTYTLFMKVRRDARFKQVDLVPEVSYIPLLMLRETGLIPPQLGQIVVNLENFLTLTHHMKVIMYLSTVVLLCWLTGHYYGNTGRERVMPENGGAANGQRTAKNFAGYDSSSERVNSADSSRSQPPSRRISRVGSLSEAASNASADNDNNNNNNNLGNQEQPRGSAAATNANGPAGQKPAALASQQQEASGAISQQSEAEKREESRAKRAAARPVARLFSKVDEERQWGAGGPPHESRRAAGANQGASVQESKAGSEAAMAGDLSERLMATHASESGRKSGAAPNESLEEPAGGSSLQQEVGASRRLAAPRKGWFMQVCSSLVRMLSGIRGSLSEAGQLEVRENDLRDKQLELLAGKIDNWYNSNTTSTSQSASPSPNQAVPESAGGPRLFEPETERDKTSAEPEADADRDPVASAGERAEVAASGAPAEPRPGGAGREPEGVAEGAGVGSRRLERGQKRVEELEAETEGSKAGSASDEQLGAEPKGGGEALELQERAEVGAEIEQPRGPEADGSDVEQAQASSQLSRVRGGSGGGGGSGDGELESSSKRAETGDAGQPQAGASEQKSEPLAGLANNNNNCTSDISGGERISDGNNNHITRKDSQQSNRTIINKSDTSGDESVAGSVISNNTTDKALAFERMELAMVAKC